MDSSTKRQEKKQMFWKHPKAWYDFPNFDTNYNHPRIPLMEAPHKSPTEI